MGPPAFNREILQQPTTPAVDADSQVEIQQMAMAGSGAHDGMGASDAEFLLPGEAFDSTYRDDAEHWAIVYEELTRFLLLSEVAVPDNLARYQRRLAFWRSRLTELVGQASAEAQAIEVPH